jgi:carboxypeptidase C (cathepsin A)
MRRAPQMRVLSLSGYYDLSTPFFATEFDLAHLYLPSALRSNLISRHYASGHMLYLDGKTFNDVTRDVRGFIRANAD